MNERIVPDSPPTDSPAPTDLRSALDAAVQDGLRPVATGLLLLLAAVASQFMINALRGLKIVPE